jgi:hypothetical protein
MHSYLLHLLCCSCTEKADTLEVTRMPQLAQVLQEADLRRKGTSTTALDLQPYFEMIDAVREAEGVGATVDLAPEESSRVEKGRLTRAARERGQKLVWRKAPESQLKFVLAEPGAPVPGARQRRKVTPAPAPVPEPVRKGRRKAS